MKNQSITERFELALDVAPAGMLILDSTGKIILANAKIEKMLGYSAGQLPGQSILSVFTEVMPNELNSIFGINLPGKTAAEYTCKHVGGELCPIQLTVTHAQLSEDVFTVASINDITEWKHNNEQLQTLTKALQRSNQDLENFAYLASHDLQAPMRAVASFACLIKEQLDVSQNSEIAEYVEILVKAARDMKALLQALLEYSRVSAVSKCHIRQVNLQELVQNVFETTFLDTKEIEITYKNLPTVTGSQILLNQLFSSLLSNSHIFRKPGSVAQVEILALDLDHEWQFSISDQGLGIDKTLIPRVFTIFTQGEDTPKIAGLGMGLAICRKITDIHRGKIWCESVRGEGSTFYFTLAK